MGNRIKRIVKSSVIMDLLLTVNETAAHGKTPKLVNEASIEKVIKAITLDEKAHFVIGTGFPGPNGVECATYAILSINSRIGTDLNSKM